MSMADVLHMQFQQIASTQFAVEAKVEKCKLANTFFELKSGADGPDVTDLEWRLLPYQFTFVP